MYSTVQITMHNNRFDESGRLSTICIVEGDKKPDSSGGSEAGRNIGTKSYKYEFGNFAQLYVVDIRTGQLSGDQREVEVLEQ